MRDTLKELFALALYGLVLLAVDIVFSDLVCVAVFLGSGAYVFSIMDEKDYRLDALELAAILTTLGISLGFFFLLPAVVAVVPKGFAAYTAFFALAFAYMGATALAMDWFAAGRRPRAKQSKTALSPVAQRQRVLWQSEREAQGRADAHLRQRIEHMQRERS